MRPIVAATLATVLSVTLAPAQTTPRSVAPLLQMSAQSVPVTAYQLQRYMMERIPKLPKPATAEQWTREAAKVRQHMLDDIASTAGRGSGSMRRRVLRMSAPWRRDQATVGENYASKSSPVTGQQLSFTSRRPPPARVQPSCMLRGMSTSGQGRGIRAKGMH